jgi:hypothetical protein
MRRVGVWLLTTGHRDNSDFGGGDASKLKQRSVVE